MVILALALAALALAGARPEPASAQILHLDPLPWRAVPDSTSRLALVVEAGRFLDPDPDWAVSRLLMTVILPGGEDGLFFLRMPHVTFDSGGLTPAERWPDILTETAPADWPGGGRVRSFGQLEVGAMGDFSLPGLGSVDFGAGLGLPIGVDRLYPFSSTSLPLRVEVRKGVRLSGGLHANLAGGFLVNMDSGKDELESDAFPSGKHLGLELALYRGRGSRLTLFGDLHDRSGRTSRLVGAEGWLPWTPDGSVGLRAARELEDIEHRPAQWYFTVSWRFDSPKYRTGPPDPEAPSAEEDEPEEDAAEGPEDDAVEDDDAGTGDGSGS